MPNCNCWEAPKTVAADYAVAPSAGEFRIFCALLVEFQGRMLLVCPLLKLSKRFMGFGVYGLGALS